MLTENMDVRKVGDRAEASAAGGAKESCENNCCVFEGRVFLSEGVLEHILLRLPLSVRVYVCGCACLREHVRGCTCVHGRNLYQYTFVHLSIVCLFTYLLVCLFVCMYVCIHHTQTRTCKRFFSSCAPTCPVSLLSLNIVAFSFSFSLFLSLSFSLSLVLSLFLSFFLSVFLSFCLPVFLFCRPPALLFPHSSLSHTRTHIFKQILRLSES